MSTIELARQLNCVETLLTTNGSLKCKKQPFDYLLVLDFEATCWEKTACDKGQSEIIEFPCILFDVKMGNILEEFQQYVMPTERPKLTQFCMDLTGIQQHQVDHGVPLKTCLFLFRKWLNELILKYSFSFQKEPYSKTCIFATWSDWDLGMCLKKECKRKRILKDEVFNKWIDIRSLYIEHYGIRPKGLLGALVEVGLNFEGKQHCGLHDARNTAKLVGQMISDGVCLRMTKDIS